MTAGDVYTADSIQVWIKNGNERAMKLIRSWEESEFQSTLAAQHSRDYKMELEQYVAALGTRGDYFMIKVPLTCTALATATAKGVNGHLYIDFIDILGVAPDVQLGKVHGYGKYSPFDSADLKVTDEMKVGVESEHLAMVLNAAVTTTTYVSQKIHGDDDARIQGRFEAAPAADTANEFWLRLKPTASNVFLMRYDSKIWVLPATATTGNGFYEA
jgi:hypothetical protein